MVEALTFFLLFLIPFVIAPFGVTQFENPKVIAAEAVAIVIFFIALIKNKAHFKDKKKQLILYVSIILLSFIHLALFRTNLTFFGNVFRMQGVFLLWILLIFSFTVSLVKFENYPWWVFLPLLIIETILIFFLPQNESHRYVGTLGEPNALATYAIFVWPFVWFGFKEKKKFRSYIKYFALFFTAVIIYLSGSKSGAIGFGIQILFIILYSRKIFLSRIVAICVVAIFLSYALPLFAKNPYENRVDVWKSASTAGTYSPLVGNGFGNTETALHKAAKKRGLPIQFYYFDSAHNIFLDWWVEGGIIGFLLITAVVYLALNNFILTGNIRELTLFLGLMTALSFNPASVVGLLSFWWLMGRGFASSETEEPKILS